jgi:hypothetical protein
MDAKALDYSSAAKRKDHSLQTSKWSLSPAELCMLHAHYKYARIVSCRA